MVDVELIQLFNRTRSTKKPNDGKKHFCDFKIKFMHWMHSMHILFFVLVAPGMIMHSRELNNVHGTLTDARNNEYIHLSNYHA